MGQCATWSLGLGSNSRGRYQLLQAAEKRFQVLRWERNTLPCGYVTGVHEALDAGIPFLKSETWGTLSVFPVILVRPSRSFSIEFSPSLKSLGPIEPLSRPVVAICSSWLC
jgi:hypothetical protein